MITTAFISTSKLELIMAQEFSETHCVSASFDVQGLSPNETVPVHVSWHFKDIEFGKRFEKFLSLKPEMQLKLDKVLDHMLDEQAAEEEVENADTPAI